MDKSKSDYLDVKITSFYSDKHMLYIKESKLLLNSIKKIKG